MLAVVASFGDSTAIMKVLESPQSLSYIGSLNFARCEKAGSFTVRLWSARPSPRYWRQNALVASLGFWRQIWTCSNTIFHLFYWPVLIFNSCILLFLCSCTAIYHRQLERNIFAGLHSKFLSFFKTGNSVGNEQSTRLGMLDWRSGWRDLCT